MSREGFDARIAGHQILTRGCEAVLEQSDFLLKALGFGLGNPARAGRFGEFLFGGGEFLGEFFVFGLDFEEALEFGFLGGELFLEIGFFRFEGFEFDLVILHALDA